MVHLVHTSLHTSLSGSTFALHERRVLPSSGSSVPVLLSVSQRDLHGGLHWVFISSISCCSLGLEAVVGYNDGHESCTVHANANDGHASLSAPGGTQPTLYEYTNIQIYKYTNIYIHMGASLPARQLIRSRTVRGSLESCTKTRNKGIQKSVIMNM